MSGRIVKRRVLAIIGAILVLGTSTSVYAISASAHIKITWNKQGNPQTPQYKMNSISVDNSKLLVLVHPNQCGTSSACIITVNIEDDNVFEIVSGDSGWVTFAVVNKDVTEESCTYSIRFNWSVGEGTPLYASTGSLISQCTTGVTGGSLSYTGTTGGDNTYTIQINS